MSKSVENRVLMKNFNYRFKMLCDVSEKSISNNNYAQFSNTKIRSFLHKNSIRQILNLSETKNTQNSQSKEKSILSAKKCMFPVIKQNS